MLEQMTHLVIQLGFIIIAAYFGGMLFQRFRLPRVLGELLAGALIGPHLLGGIPLPGFPEGFFFSKGIFPVSSELYAFSTVASILLLFLVGLETDLKMFLKCSVAGSFVGIGGAFISFFIGDLVVVLLGPMVLGRPMAFLDAEPLFLGVISAATSVGITARVLSDNRKIDSPEGVTILSGAVIDDVLGIILLAIVVGAAKSGQLEWGQALYIGSRSFGIWLVCTVVGIILAKRFGSLLRNIQSPAAASVLGLGTALIVAGVFEHSGLAMIIGAYVVGLSLSQTDMAHIMVDKLSGVYNFFIPVFFCVMGMLVDFRVFANEKILILGLAYTLTAVAAKLAGCSLPALGLNFNALGAIRIGLGMVPRGEVALIIAGIGLSNGSIGQDAFGVAMMMTFLTTLLTPYLLTLSFRVSGKSTRKPIMDEDQQEQIRFAMPSAETSEWMTSHVVQAFEQEGFFVRPFGIRKELFQIRKEDLLITFRPSPTHLTFNCRSSAKPLIYTVTYEVLADLERTIQNLKQLTERKDIGRQIMSSPPDKETPKRTRLSDALSPDAVERHLKSRDKEGVLREMIDLLIRSGRIDPKAKEGILKDVLEREKGMSTGMQEGIAMPHARSQYVERLHCAVGISKKGVDFKSIDGKPARIFILTVAPKGSAGRYLQFMASISQLLSDPKRRKQLLKSKTSEELYAYLDGR